MACTESAFGTFVAVIPETRVKEQVMSGKNTAVFGIYQTREGAEEAVDSLRRAHFRNTDISALFPDNAGTKDFAHEKNTKAPEGATTGATSGAIAGGVLGWLAGIGALAIPGIGPFIAAGPIVTALAGAGALGALGGIVGALVGMGIPEYEAKRYEGRVKHGGILLSVHCDDHDWVKRAEEILKRTGAENISSTSEASADFAVSDKPMLRTRGQISEEMPVNGMHETLEERAAAHRAMEQRSAEHQAMEQPTAEHQTVDPLAAKLGNDRPTTRLDA
jgi:hypothetical protein